MKIQYKEIAFQQKTRDIIEIDDVPSAEEDEG